METINKQIPVLVETPFNSFVSTNAGYNPNNRTLLIKDGGDLNERNVTVNLSLAMDEDLVAIRRDILDKKRTGDEKYADYDPSDIVLENVKIKGRFVQCTYTVNAGVYRRLCVGLLSEVSKDARAGHDHYFAYVPAYSGKVCW